MEVGSCSRHASRTASLTWSASLSGCPSFTDSEVKRKLDSSAIAALLVLPGLLLSCASFALSSVLDSRLLSLACCAKAARRLFNDSYFWMVLPKRRPRSGDRDRPDVVIFAPPSTFQVLHRGPRNPKSEIFAKEERERVENPCYHAPPKRKNECPTHTPHTFWSWCVFEC